MKENSIINSQYRSTKSSPINYSLKKKKRFFNNIQKHDEKIKLKKSKLISYILILTFLLFLMISFGCILNERGLVDLLNDEKINNEGNEYYFNITKFLVTNNTCQDFSLVEDKKINEYFGKIKSYLNVKNLINYIGYFSIIISLILYLLFRLKITWKKFSIIFSSKFDLFISYLLIVLELFIILLYFYLYLSLEYIIDYIKKCLFAKCIVMLTYDYSIKLLQERIKILLILILYRLIVFQILLYTLKKVIVFEDL